MRLDGGMSLLLAAVAALEPARYTDIEAYMHPMCERLVGSHLKRLHTRNLVEYNAGVYTLTEEGKTTYEDQ